MRIAFMQGIVIAALAYAAPAGAQRRIELGMDAGMAIQLESESQVRLTVPRGRVRAGFYEIGDRLAIEPAGSFSYTKIEGFPGGLGYTLELGTPYHFRPLLLGDDSEVAGATPYVRPFASISGTLRRVGGSYNAFSAGAGLGTKIPWRRDLAWRIEANARYNFEEDIPALGALVGLSIFPRSDTDSR